MKRWIFLTLGCLAFGWVMGELARATVHRPVLVEDLGAAMEIEAERARGIGITEELAAGVEDLTRSGDRAWSRPVELAEGQCVAAIVGVTGSVGDRKLRGLEVLDQGAATVYAHSPEGQRGADGGHDLSQPSLFVTQVQWCAEVAGIHLIVASTESFPADIFPGVRLRFHLLRSPPGAQIGLTELSRTRLSDSVRARLAAAREARINGARQPLGRPLFSELWITAQGGARLLPESDPVWLGLLRALSEGDRREANPRVDRHDRGSPLSRPGAGPEGERSDLPAPHAPLLRADGSILRILAAVDLGDLGAPCVALRFTRRRGDYEAPPLARVRVGGAGETWARDSIAPEGPPTVLSAVLSTVDRSCPARGLHLYAVPAADTADYSLEAFAIEAPPGARAEPSRYDGSLPDPPLVAQARALCEREPGEAEACLTLGRFLSAARVPTRDLAGATRALSRACELGSMEACLRRALMEEPADLRLLRRACDGGSSAACAHLGDALRLGQGTEADYPAALAAYERACELGAGSVGCANEQAMGRYWLGSPPTTP